MSTSLSETHTPPDAELFKIRFPSFGSVSDLLVDMVIDEMSDHVDERWRAKDYQPAIMYLTAHRLTLEGEPQRSIAVHGAKDGSAQALTSGVVKSVTVDDVKTEFVEAGTVNAAFGATSLAKLSGDALDYTLTPYGRRFMQLRKVNHGGPRVFTP